MLEQLYEHAAHVADDVPAMRRSKIQAGHIIPEEILNKIMVLVPHQNLKALALVNKRFKDTAFSHQFQRIIASPMCDLGAWVALIDVDASVTAAVRDITISGDSVGEQTLVSAEYFLTRFPFVRSVLLQAYDPDFTRLAQHPLRSVRHLCIYNGMLTDIWEYIGVAFPNLGTLSLIDFVASRFIASSALGKERERGSSSLTGMFLETNDENLLERCFKALQSNEWFSCVTVLEVRCTTAAVETIVQQFPGVVQRMETLTLLSIDFLRLSPSIKWSGALNSLRKLVVNCADSDIQPMQTVVNLPACCTLGSIHIICCVHYLNTDFEKWKAAVTKLGLGRFESLQQLEVILFASPLLKSFSAIRKIQEEVKHLFVDEEGSFAVNIRVAPHAIYCV